MTLITLPAFSEDNKLPASGQPQAQAPGQPQAQVQPTVSTPAVPAPVTSVPASTPVPVTAVPAATIPPSPVSEDNSAVKELSIYGEVQAVNTVANSLTVQYYDYDSDEEKTVEITADKDTKIENAAALANISKSDWVDITYAAAGGKNLAKSIMVEKEEKEEEKTAASATTNTKPAETPDTE